MSHNQKGLTLVELLVSIFIVVLVVAAVSVTYNTLLKGFKSRTAEVETEIAIAPSLEMLRIDIEHAGYGIASNEDSLIISWDDTNKELSLRSTLINTNKSTRGWILIEKDNASARVVNDEREDKTVENFTILRAADKTAVANNADCNNPNNDDERYFTLNIDNNGNINSGFDEDCLDPPSGIPAVYYIGFPIDKDISNSCTKGYCYLIRYSLSSANLSDRCNPNTQNLVRIVANATGGEPIIECVADWYIDADLDTDLDGTVDSQNANLPNNNTDLRNQLKILNVYILIQEGGYNPDFVFNQTRTCGTDICINDPYLPSGVDLKLPSGYEKYKWRVLKLRIKPINLQ